MLNQCTFNKSIQNELCGLSHLAHPFCKFWQKNTITIIIVNYKCFISHIRGEEFLFLWRVYKCCRFWPWGSFSIERQWAQLHRHVLLLESFWSDLNAEIKIRVPLILGLAIFFTNLSERSKSCSCPRKLKLGEMLGLQSRTKSYAASRESSCSAIRYATVIVTDREIPARQWTKTPCFFCRASSAKIYHIQSEW